MAHRLAALARADLDEIWTYLFMQTSSETIADRQIDLITARFQVLAAWPRLGRSRWDLRRGLRSHAVGNWVIFIA